MTGNIMAWPAGPIAWNGLNGTWPISVWSPGTIGGLAFGLGTGFTNFGVTAVGYPNIVASTITTPWLNAFVPTVGAGAGWGAGLFGPAGLNAPAFGYTGAYSPYLTGLGYGYGAYGTGFGFDGTWANGAFGPGWGGAWWTPTLTNSALMFNNLAAINTFTPYTFNVTFTAQSAAQASAITTASLMNNMGVLSIYATPITAANLAATSTIPFMSMAYPFWGAGWGAGLGAGLGVGTVGVGLL